MAGHCHPPLLASSLMVRIRTFLQPTGNHIEGNDDTNILFSTTVYNKWCSAAAASSTSRTAYFIWWGTRMNVMSQSHHCSFY